MAVAEPQLSLWVPSWDVVVSKVDTSMLSGAIGGPLAVGLLTPQRNAMTLAAKDLASTYVGLYRKVFAKGFVNGFCGGSRPMLAAVPQFTAIGPVYLLAEKRTGSTALSMLVASYVESICTFSAQRRNAQIQYNATCTNSAERLAHQPLHHLTGPGFACHVGRNLFAMTGIRLLSPHSLEVVQRFPGASRVGEETKVVAADFVSSVFAATVSMPFNHIFSWASCTPSLEEMNYLERAKASVSFLVSTYRAQGLELLARDLTVRISYTGLLFTVYRAVERRLERPAS